jgi:predicted transposase YdaD
MRPKKKVVEEAKAMLSRSETARVKSAILELVSTIMIHKFNTLSREEVNKMLGIQLQKTKVYQEARAEEAAGNALMLLDQKLGSLDDAIVASINELNLDQLRSLIRGVINFETTADLQKFLDSLS